MTFLSALAEWPRQRLRRLFIRAALAFASALLAAIGLGFATYALFAALRLQYGVVNASIGLGAIYFILAGIVYLCSRRIGAKSANMKASAPISGLTADSEALKAAAQSASEQQAAVLALGIELAKQLTPVQLAVLGLLSGFVAGRKL